MERRSQQAVRAQPRRVAVKTALTGRLQVNCNHAHCRLLRPRSIRAVVRLFAPIPKLANWKREADLAIGGTHFSARVITADDPGDEGKNGEIELGWMENGKPVYFYYCLPIVK